MQRTTQAAFGAILATAGALLNAAAAPGQIFIRPNGRVVEGPTETADSQQLFVTEREMTQRLTRAKQLIDQKQFSPALTLLQGILDRPEDLFYHADSEDEGSPFGSLKLEAQKIIAGLPEDGRRTYENEYGFTARQLLDESIQSGEVDQFREVVQRFFQTAAGYAATHRLAMYHFDRGEPLAAALLFDRLRQIPEAARPLEPTLSLKTALAWNRAGLSGRSTEVLLDLKQNVPSGRISLGGRDIPLFAQTEQALPWLVETLGARPESAGGVEDSWAVFRGNASRTGSAVPASPIWQTAWTYDALERTDSSDPAQVAQCAAEFRQLQRSLRESSEFLALPAVHPLVVGDTVVFRTMSNVRAVDLKSGSTLWESAKIDPSYELMIEQANNPLATHNKVGSARTPRETFMMQRAWRDLTHGTLSSDGKYVFSLEDLGFLGPFAATSTRGATHPLAARDFNRLMAFELATGKLKWELGGERGEPEMDLAGAFFLGPPLPIEGELYCLTEENGEIRLVAIEIDERDPERPQPKVAWAQRLIYPENQLLTHSIRRLAGLSPSYADGVIVCPTAAGAVVAVDLTRRMLLWGYRYTTNVPESVAVRNAMVWAQATGRSGMSGLDDEERWLDDVPTIADGHVLLTPRDSNELHCVSLVDGAPKWKPIPRGQGLYVAGVHEGDVIVVGRTHVQAYRLTDGTPAWEDPPAIPMPSGRGVQVGRYYHLPLSTGEIATVDLDAGRVLARSASPDGEVPGNLVAAGGAIVSQAADALVGLRPLGAIEQEIEQTLRQDSEDARALARRGELRLHRGEQAAGLTDLRRSVESESDPLTRQLLVTTLVEGLRTDFDEYRQFAGEIEDLIDDPELRTRYLRLFAAGLETSGEIHAAFEKYLALAEASESEPQAESSDSALSVRDDRWIAARLARLHEKASPEQQEQMERAVQDRLETALAGEGPEPARQFVQRFSGLRQADEARRALVERLDFKADSLELERYLEQLRRSSDPATAGWATAQHVSLLAQLHRPNEAAALLGELTERWGDVVCLDSKTGRELAREWRADDEVASAIERTNWLGEKPLQANRLDRRGNVEQTTPIEIIGSQGPYFEGWTFAIDQRRQELLAFDENGEERWETTITRNTGRTVQGHYGLYGRIHGHLVAIVFGNFFAVFDALTPSGEPRLLWKRDLYEMSAIDGINRAAQQRIIAAPGGQRIVIADSMGRQIGMLGPILAETLVYQVGTDLFAVEPLSGERLWVRRNVPRGSELFGDDEYLFAVPPGSNRALVFRTSDGEQLGLRTVPERQHRVTIRGRTILSWSPDEEHGELVLTDAFSGEAVWSHKFAVASEIALVRSDEVAVLEPGGRFVIFRLDDGGSQVEAEVDAVEGLADVVVRRSGDRYILLTRSSERDQDDLRIVVANNRFAQVNGTAYGFDRRTGRRLWATKIDDSVIDPSQPEGLPVLVLTAQSIPMAQPGRAGFGRTRHALTILDVRSGAILYEEDEKGATIPFRIGVEPDLLQIEITFGDFRIELTPAGKSTVEAPEVPAGA